MTTSVSVALFLAQLALLALAFVIGEMLGRRSAKVAETSALLLAPLAIGWALRSGAQDALLRILPLDVLVYTEGTLILPVAMFVAGAVTGARAHGVEWARVWRTGPLLATFGVAFFVNSAMWMLLPAARVADWIPPARVAHTTDARRLPSVFFQSGSESCVAAALATALSASGVGLRMSEADLVELADVRKGVGATMLRAYKGLRDALIRSPFEPVLHVATAEEAIAMATRDRPVVVALRSSLTQSHMVVVFGKNHRGDVVLANPWRNTSLGEPVSGAPEGIRRLSFDTFKQLYRGQAIAIVDRARSGV